MNLFYGVVVIMVFADRRGRAFEPNAVIRFVALAHFGPYPLIPISYCRRDEYQYYSEWPEQGVLECVARFVHFRVQRPTLPHFVRNEEIDAEFKPAPIIANHDVMARAEFTRFNYVF